MRAIHSQGSGIVITHDGYPPKLDKKKDNVVVPGSIPNVPRPLVSKGLLTDLILKPEYKNGSCRRTHEWSSEKFFFSNICIVPCPAGTHVLFNTTVEPRVHAWLRSSGFKNGRQLSAESSLGSCCFFYEANWERPSSRHRPPRNKHTITHEPLKVDNREILNI